MSGRDDTVGRGSLTTVSLPSLWWHN